MLLRRYVPTAAKVSQLSVDHLTKPPIGRASADSDLPSRRWDKGKVMAKTVPSKDVDKLKAGERNTVVQRYVWHKLCIAGETKLRTQSSLRHVQIC